MDTNENAVASALRDLGTGNAGTKMGAIEFLAVQIKEGLEAIASALADGLEDVAQAIDLRDATDKDS